MANFMLVRQRVRDYAKRRPGFDAATPQRDSAGLSGVLVMRGSVDPNEIVILFQAADIERAGTDATSPELREATQKAGFIGMPDVQFLVEQP